VSVPEDPSGGVTALLRHWVSGEDKALGELIPVVHRELLHIAHHHLQSERAQHTLTSTALVNEAFLRLLGSQPPELQNRSHFMAVASRLMRQVLVDYSRKRRANKRDAGLRINFDALANFPICKDRELIALDDALEALSRIDERQAKVVEMRFFGGMTAPEISEVLGVSRNTVERDWATARIFLFAQMRESHQS
jgi:RNA polymerase sigma-70 factor, ECF subfamily